MAEFRIEGFDELISKIEKMQITEQEERKALNIAGELIKQNVENESPVDTEKTKKSVKKQIKRIDGNMSCVIKVDKWYAKFQEYGTSQSKANVGWFEKAIRDKEKEAISLIAKELSK